MTFVCTHPYLYGNRFKCRNHKQIFHNYADGKVLASASLQVQKNSKHAAQFMPCWRQIIFKSELAAWDNDYTDARSVLNNNNMNKEQITKYLLKYYLNYKIQEAQLMLTNPCDAFRGQSRSPKIVTFHMLGIVSSCAIAVEGHSRSLKVVWFHRLCMVSY